MSGVRKYALGIDWGTYNSAAAYYDGTRTRMVESNEGTTEQGKAFPSFLYFDLEGNVQEYGRRAKSHLIDSPEQVVWGVKRLIGLSYDEAVQKKELDRFAYETEKSGDGGISIRVGRQSFTPTDLCETMLRHIKREAENTRNLGTTVDDAQLAIPAYFDDTRAQEIVEAANRVGFKTVRTIIEPTAACFKHGLNAAEDQYVLAVSMGAGTFEAVAGILTREPNSSNNLVFMAKGIAGDPMLGGITIDDSLVSYLIDTKVKTDLRGLVRSNKAISAGLRQEAERAKIQLSSRSICEIDFAHEGRVYLPSATLTRTELETIARPILERCKGPIRVALSEAKLSCEELDALVLIGGPMKMPAVRDYLQQIVAFDGPKLVNPVIYRALQAIAEESFRLDPMQCVAEGAAISSGFSVALEPTPYSYGSIRITKQTTELDGTRLTVYDYNPIIEAGSLSETEGSSDYRVIVEESRGVGQVEFTLIVAYKMLNPQTDQPCLKYRELGSYTINIPLAAPSIRYTLRRNLANRRVDLIVRHPQIGEEWTFHKVQVLTGRERNFPETRRLQPFTFQPARDEGQWKPETSREDEDRTYAKKLSDSLNSLERIGNMLGREAEVLISLKQTQMTDEDAQLLASQLAKLKSALGDPGALQRLTEDRYVLIANQALALIHDLEVTRPPLLTRASANEWRRKIPLWR
jgi:molecular chaperone DnaK (HSP70)